MRHLLVGFLGFVCAANAGFTAPLTFDGPQAFSLPRVELGSADLAKFNYGRGLFHHAWSVQVHADGAQSGLGPIYNATSCAACHVRDGRGRPPEPGGDATSFVLKLSVGHEVVDGVSMLRPDPVYGGQLQDHSIAGLPPEGRISVRYDTHKVVMADGDVVWLRQPQFDIADPGYGDLSTALRAGGRVAPPLIGLGLLEAIPMAEILAFADPDDVNNDGISGRASWVHQADMTTPVLGRFGWKASTMSVRQQSDMAAAIDMGLSSPLMDRYAGDCTARQVVCLNASLKKPQGKDFELDENEAALLAFYTANLAVPPRRDAGRDDVVAGGQVFAEIGCAACHIAAPLGGEAIIPYTDLLLHDMGPGLADEIFVGVATGAEWRTPPLWGIGLTKQVSGHTQFLHDGRARNLMEAIVWHGGEAQSARDRFVALSSLAQENLLVFLNSL